MKKDKLKEFIKSSATAYRKAQIAKNLGVELAGDWRYAARKLRPMGSKYTGKHTPKTFEDIGAVPKKVLEKIDEISKERNKIIPGAEVGATISKEGKPDYIKGYYGIVPFDLRKITTAKRTIHTHPTIRLSPSEDLIRTIVGSKAATMGWMIANLSEKIFKKRITTSGKFSNAIATRLYRNKKIKRVLDAVADSPEIKKEYETVSDVHEALRPSGGRKYNRYGEKARLGDMGMFGIAGRDAHHTIYNPETKTEAIHKLMKFRRTRKVLKEGKIAPKDFYPSIKPYRSVYINRNK